MPQQKRRWLDLLLIPVVVGLVVAVGSYFIPKLFEEGKVLSYSVDGPISYLNKDIEGDVMIQIGEETTRDLYAYRVEIRNSGDEPLTNVPVRIVFDADSTDFRIFNVSHNTNPSYEFGEIKVEDRGSTSIRFVYELLNPSHRDNVTLLTNSRAEPVVYAKYQGLVLQAVDDDDGSGFPLENIILIFPVLAAVASLFTELISKYFEALSSENDRVEPESPDKGEISEEITIRMERLLEELEQRNLGDKEDT